MSAPTAEPRFRSLVDRLGAVVWEATPGERGAEAVFSFVSEGTEAMLGYPPERWLADPRFWFEMIHPEDRERVFAQSGAILAEAGGADVEYRCRTADGRTLWVRNIIQADMTPGGLRLSGVLIDISGQMVAEARLHRLQELTDALSGILSAREVAAVVAARGRAAVGAAAVAVFLRSGDELEISGYDGYPEDAIQEYCTIPLDHPVPAAEAARTGEGIVLDALELDVRYPGLGSWRKLAGSGQFVALPLQAEGRTLGSIALRMSDAGLVGPSDRVVLDVLARACASALLRAEHSQAEQDARRRAEDARAVLDSIIATAPEGFGLFDRELRFVRVNAALAEINGLPAADHVGRSFSEVAPGIGDEGHAEPLRQVVETGEPIVDMEVSGRVHGDPDRDRTFLISWYPIHDAAKEIAYVGAIVVDITDRKHAEVRSAVLAELGAILDDVGGMQERLGRVANLLVPALCDTCTVSLRVPEGGLERVAVRDVEPELEVLIAGRPPPAIEARHTRVVDPSQDAGAADGAEGRELQRRLGLRCAVVVPLLVRGRHLGSLALGRRRAGAFAAADVELAEEIARRAALAVDNARLHEGERMARERTERQYSVAAALADALTAADVATATLAEVVSAVGAEHGTMWQISEDGTALEAIGWRGFSDDEMTGHRRVPLSAHRPVADCIRARHPLRFATGEELRAAYPGLADGLRERGLRSAAAFPLLSAGRVVGGLFVSSTRSRALRPDDLALGAGLAAQAAQALERARLFEAEREVSVTLQRSLLPAALPAVEGVEIDLRYLPAAGLEAGGDFYEALSLPDGTLLIAVGDVVGRGAQAAAAMGQLRSALRAFALVGEEPGAILARLSAFADTVDGAMAATAVVGKLDPASGRLSYACAGHPWPLLARADGSAEYLQAGRGVPLACLGESEYPEATVQLDPGTTILLYTDGLTERRGQPIDAVLERLRTVAAACAADELSVLLDGAVAGVGEAAPSDDVALVAVRVTGGGSVRRATFPAEIAQVPVARGLVREWLADLDVAQATVVDLLLASGEAFANAVEHSDSVEAELVLHCPEPAVVEIVVRDHGRWKDPAVSPHRGRGFKLIRALVDDVDLQRGSDGTVVRLRHRIGDA